MFRRALQITEVSLGPNHPDVATRLNNLASLLLYTDRRRDAEPMFRRALLILLGFLRETGHQHPKLEFAFVVYIAILIALELPEADIRARLASVFDEAGLPRPEGL